MYSLGQWLSVSITKKKRTKIRLRRTLTECRIGIAGENTAGTVLEKDLLENRRMQEIQFKKNHLKHLTAP